MTRTMIDAVNARNILKADANPQMVAGYIDTIRIPCWTQEDWDLFPNAVKVRIAKKATTNDGHVLDVEPGDATPDQAPGWVTMRRQAGVSPAVYCNASMWPAVRAEFAKQHVAEPFWWIAREDGTKNIPAGAIARQHTLDVDPGIDISSVADFWPGVDSIDVNPINGGSPLREELIMQGLATADDYISVPVPAGATALYVGAAYGRVVNITELWAIGPTPAGGDRTKANRTFLGAWTIDSDRPGPIPFPAGTRFLTIRFNAKHAFTAFAD